jgi:hypothetical protein
MFGHMIPANSCGYWIDPDGRNAAGGTSNTGPLIRNELFEMGIVQRAEETPPWLIVDKNICTVIVTGWPVRLWRANVLALGDMSNLIPNCGYLRATKIQLLEQVPAHQLFGARGTFFAAILDFVQTIECEDALALMNHERFQATIAAANSGYASAWKAWACQCDPKNEADFVDADWRGTLAAPQFGRNFQSPVHGGFLLLHSEIRRRAKSLQGEAAFISSVDPDDGELNVSLAAHWSACFDALLCQAMALCAPMLLTFEQSQSMLACGDMLESIVKSRISERKP